MISIETTEEALTAGLLLLILFYISWSYMSQKARENNAATSASAPRTNVTHLPKAQPPLSISQKKIDRLLPSKPGRRVVTCCANEILMDKINGEWKFKELLKSSLEDLVAVSDLYIISYVTNLEEHDQIIEEFKNNNLFKEKDNCLGIHPHKLLVCTTKIGKTAIVRQLDPQLHLDYDKEVANGLQPFIYQIGVKDEQPFTETSPNMFQFSSLKDYLQC